jgi:hypothetical protein
VNARSTLRGDFWHKVKQILEDLIMRTKNPQILDHLHSALEDDWEFQFTLNYCLRGESYDRQPYA